MLGKVRQHQSSSDAGYVTIKFKDLQALPSAELCKIVIRYDYETVCLNKELSEKKNVIAQLQASLREHEEQVQLMKALGVEDAGNYSIGSRQSNESIDDGENLPTDTSTSCVNSRVLEEFVLKNLILKKNNDILKLEVRSISSDLIYAQERLEQSSSKCAALTEQLSALQQVSDSQTDRIAHLEKDSQELRDSLKKAEGQSGQLGDRLRQICEKVHALKKTKEFLKKEIQNYRTELDSQTRTLMQQWELNLQATRSQNRHTDVNKLQKQLEKSKIRNQQLVKKLIELKHKQEIASKTVLRQCKTDKPWIEPIVQGLEQLYKHLVAHISVSGNTYSLDAQHFLCFEKSLNRLIEATHDL